MPTTITTTTVEEAQAPKTELSTKQAALLKELDRVAAGIKQAVERTKHEMRETFLATGTSAGSLT